MKIIPLTQGKVALVDDEDFLYLNKFNWYAHKNTTAKTYYALRSICGNKTIIKIKMHREIMGCVKGDGKLIDHRDLDGLNNQKSNLRIATPSQNGMNARSHGKSKYLGVAWHKPLNKWRSQIKYKKKLHLGYFHNEEEAAKAYDVAASKYFGEFANLNFKNHPEHV